MHRGSKKAGNMILEKIGEYRREIGQRRIGQMARVGHPAHWMNSMFVAAFALGFFVAPLRFYCRFAALRASLRRKEGSFS